MQNIIQYDRENIAVDYNRESQEFKEHDPGRRFLYACMERFARESVVLDVGCGSGIDVAAYSRMGFKNIAGVDPSEKILGEAKELNPNVSFMVGSFEDIPTLNNSVDVLVSRHALHYSQNLQLAFGEVDRVLKLGGFFLAVTSNPKFDSMLPTDGSGNIQVTLFGGRIPITFPQHTLSEYFSEEFFRHFELITEFEYNGVERDDYVEGKNNTFAFVARKIG